MKIVGSFAQAHCFPRAVAYLDSGKINVKGMVRPIHRTHFSIKTLTGHLQVTDVFALSDYQKALDKMNSRQAVKIAVKPRI